MMSVAVPNSEEASHRVHYWKATKRFIGDLKIRNEFRFRSHVCFCQRIRHFESQWYTAQKMLLPP